MPGRPDPLDPDDDRKPCCPSCGGHTIWRYSDHWRCEDCGRFASPDYAEPEHLTVQRPHLSAAGRAAEGHHGD